MIRRVEALGYRSLRDLSVVLGPFHVLVGPNESGKTTFFDVFSFLRTLVSQGIDPAIRERTEDFRDLLWRREGAGFELAIEARIPEELRRILPEEQLDAVRYEVALAWEGEMQDVEIRAEKVLLKAEVSPPAVERDFFPFDSPPRKTILSSKSSQARTVVTKSPGGKDNYYSEVYPERGKGWLAAFQLGQRVSALGNVPQDPSKFPVTTWFRDLLTRGVRVLAPIGALLRKPSGPAQKLDLEPDGSNLPWVVARLKEELPERFNHWIEHMRTALPDLESVRVMERAEDRHRYLLLRYQNGLEVPCWGASEGTLRLLVFTLLAYLPGLTGVTLVEEPENGIHPRAVRTLFQSLSAVRHAQILVATHSPVVLSAAEPSQVLCFAKTAGGATDVVAGHEHPALEAWKGERNLGALFAEGVLG